MTVPPDARSIRALGHLVLTITALHFALAIAARPAFAQGTCNPPTPGAARAWEASMDVGTYTRVNVRSGDLLTVIPIVSWSGLGPDVNFSLIHNSYHADSGIDINHSTKFNMGEGWQSTYSARLIFTNLTTTKVVFDDGSIDTYTKSGSVWVPPAGVHNTLTVSSGTWTLKFKDQSKLTFNSVGRLTAVTDAVGKSITLTRDGSNRLISIADASGRKLAFDYDDDRLVAIVDLKAGGDYTYDYNANLNISESNSEPGGSGLTDNRVWFIEYDEDDRLNVITDPEENTITVEYDDDGRIASIEDKDGDAFTYSYHSTTHALDTVTDPDTLDPQYEQSFDYVCPPACACPHTEYTDRRGKVWVYEWSVSGALEELEDPLEHVQTYEFDANRNLVSYKDALDNEWTFTYDGSGNLEQTFTPLMPNSGGSPTPKSERTYDSYNNLTSITDGEGNTVTIDYELGSYPTLPTTITLPADGEGNDALEIVLTYYDNTTPMAEGQLESVTMVEVREDHDILLAHFEYDDWGQLDYYGEGEIPDPELGDCCVCFRDPASDSGGRLVGGSGPAGAATFSSSLSDNYPTGAVCAAWVAAESFNSLPAGFPDVPCGSLGVAQLDGGWDASSPGNYTPMGLLQHLEATIGEGQRTYEATYDGLGRVLGTEVASSNEGANSFTRGFSYNPEWAADGEITRVGPDGKETTITLDDAGRVESLERDGVTAGYTYDERGLVTDVSYGNGARIEYEYDEDHRVIRIEHFDESDDTVLKLEYAYDNRDLPTEILESDEGGAYASTAFVYDNRGRLIAETRVVISGPSPEYDLEYVYDQAGNRTAKLDNLNELATYYTYDIDDTETYGTNSNRLQFYEVWDTSGESSALVSTTWYIYDDLTFDGDDDLQWGGEGNPVRIITEMADSPGEYTAVHFVYDLGQRVWVMYGESWEEDGLDEDDCPDSYAITWAREFRYDGGRARYLNRELDPEALEGGDIVALEDGEETWTVYDGDESYADYMVEEDTPYSTITDLRIYEPGVALKDPIDESTGIEYYHADHLGTTRAMTDYAGASASSTVYTAFGERLSAGYERYGYVGAYGYQAHDFPDGSPVQFLHVGARYYDPASGRFLQRDPMGASGGLNYYDYAMSIATSVIDPTDLQSCGCKCPCCAQGKCRGTSSPYDDTQVNLPVFGIPIKDVRPITDDIAARGRACIKWAFDRSVYPSRIWIQNHVHALPGTIHSVFDAIQSIVGDLFRNDPTGHGGSNASEPDLPPGRAIPKMGCLTKTTLVTTEAGDVAVEYVREGDMLWGTTDCRMGSRKMTVVRISHYFVRDLVEIVANGETITVSGEHPIATHRGWVVASQLKDSDSLLTMSGEYLCIEQLAKNHLCEDEEVINLEVADEHVYAIGMIELIVHNKIVPY